jgi:hypothetical protein
MVRPIDELAQADVPILRRLRLNGRQEIVVSVEREQIVGDRDGKTSADFAADPHLVEVQGPQHLGCKAGTTQEADGSGCQEA